MVTNLMLAGDLSACLAGRDSSEDCTKHIMFQVVHAIHFLHERNIIHRDIKLDNILVKNQPEITASGEAYPGIVLADFGCA